MSTMAIAIVITPMYAMRCSPVNPPRLGRALLKRSNPDKKSAVSLRRRMSADMWFPPHRRSRSPSRFTLSIICPVLVESTICLNNMNNYQTFNSRIELRVSFSLKSILQHSALLGLKRDLGPHQRKTPSAS